MAGLKKEDILEYLKLTKQLQYLEIYQILMIYILTHLFRNIVNTVNKVPLLHGRGRERSRM